MDTKKIYDAQLSVSKIIDDDLINDLVNKLEVIGSSAYNYNSKSIMITKSEEDINDDIRIKSILKDWINEIDISKEDHKILIDNIDILFNITKLNDCNDTKHIINLYLY